MLTVGDLDTLLYDVVRHIRATSRSTRMAALNTGLEELVTAVRQVRPEWFMRTVVFNLPANRFEVALTSAVHADFGTFVPDELLTLFSPGPQAATLDGAIGVTSDRAVIFTYASVESQTYRANTMLAPTSCERVFYDFIQPNGVPTLAIAPALPAALRIVLRYYGHPARYSQTDLERQVTFVEERWQRLIQAAALKALTQGINDAAKSAYSDDLERYKAEMKQDVARATRGDHQAMGSAMHFLGNA